jgi:hypothetical protein
MPTIVSSVKPYAFCQKTIRGHRKMFRRKKLLVSPFWFVCLFLFSFVAENHLLTTTYGLCMRLCVLATALVWIAGWLWNKLQADQLKRALELWLLVFNVFCCALGTRFSLTAKTVSCLRRGQEPGTLARYSRQVLSGQP